MNEEVGLKYLTSPRCYKRILSSNYCNKIRYIPENYNFIKCFSRYRLICIIARNSKNENTARLINRLIIWPLKADDTCRLLISPINTHMPQKLKYQNKNMAHKRITKFLAPTRNVGSFFRRKVFDGFLFYISVNKILGGYIFWQQDWLSVLLSAEILSANIRFLQIQFPFVVDIGTVSLMHRVNKNFTKDHTNVSSPINCYLRSRVSVYWRITQILG